MAGNELIDGYVRLVARRLGRLGDAERRDIADELRDHLAEAAEALASSSDQAARRAVERFGSPELIAAGLLAARRQEPADRPWLRRLAVMCCLLWPAFALAWWSSAVLERASGWGSWAQAAYMIGAVALTFAVSLTVGLCVVLARAFGGLGWWGRSGTGLGAAAAAASAFGWMVALWGGLLALATLSVAVGLSRHHLAPRAPVAAFAGAAALAAIIWSVTPAATAPYGGLAAVSVGAAVAALGALALRRGARP